MILDFIDGITELLGYSVFHDFWAREYDFSLSVTFVHYFFDVIEVEHAVSADVFRHDNDVTQAGIDVHIRQNAHVEGTFRKVDHAFDVVTGLQRVDMHADNCFTQISDRAHG